jgi:MFS family permease
VETASTRSNVRTIAVASGATLVVTLPPYFSGVLVLQLTNDLKFGVAAFGAATAVHYGFGAGLSFHAGRLVDVLGAARSLQIAMLLTTLSSFGIGYATTSWFGLAAFLALGGASHAFCQPAVNRLIVNRIGPKTMGIAFGVKQSAPPVGSLLAGLVVPAMAFAFGWQSTFYLSAVLSLAVMLAVGRPQVPPAGLGERPKRTPLAQRNLLLWLTLAFSFAVGANAATLAFYVDAAVTAGTTQQRAGVFFAIASVVSVVTRIAAGAALDRTAVVPLKLVACLVGAGAVGFVLLATQRTGLMVIGVVLALGLNWGFPSAFWIGLMRLYPDQPGRITGAMQPGGFGAMLVPLVFGIVVEARGYTSAWLMLLIISVVSTSVFFYCANRLVVPEDSGS